MTYLFAAAFVALTVPGFVLAVRALPWVSRQVELGVKPWACDVCACFWVTAVLCALTAGVKGWQYALVAGPAYTVALGILSHLERPTTPAPSLSPWAEAAPEPEREGLADRLEGDA